MDVSPECFPFIADEPVKRPIADRDLLIVFDDEGALIPVQRIYRCARRRGDGADFMNGLDVDGDYESVFGDSFYVIDL